MIHGIKILPHFFDAVVSGRKPFEVRLNDRPYASGDYVGLNEYSDDTGYTGRCALFEITYVLDDPRWCHEGSVILGIRPCRILPTYTALVAAQVYERGDTNG